MGLRARTTSLLGLALAASATLTSGAYAAVYTGTGGAFADATVAGVPAEVTFQIPVSGVGQNIESINSVTWTGLSHTWVGDANFTLISPNGTQLEIWGPPDLDSSNVNGTYVMVENAAAPTLDETSVPLGDNDTIPSGTYAITKFLSTSAPGTRTSFAPLLGGPVDGTWTLRVRDYGVGDTGGLGSWSLDVTPVPEPTSLGLLAAGAGLVALRRRRA